MNSADSGNKIVAEYSDRLASERSRRSAYENQHKQLGFIKLAIAAFTIVAVAVALKSRATSIFWLLVPVISLAALEKLHGRVLVSIRKCKRIVSFYERGLARLENRWMGTGETGEDFLDPSHPYSRDLDLFGKGSLFELLCTARTSPGKNILARWLLYPASVQEINGRQQAIQELTPRLNLREEMAVSGEDIRSRARTEALISWAEASPVLKPGPGQVMAFILAALWLLSLVLWAVSGFWEPTLVIGFVNCIFYSRFKARAQKIIGAEAFVREFALLPVILARLEQETFSASKLVALQAQLQHEGISSAASIGRLRRLVESMESRRNLLITVSDPFILWSTQLAFAIERWRQKFAPAFRQWLAAVGEMEALNAFAGYAYEHPEDVFPKLASEGAFFAADGLAHPLLPRAKAVRNNVNLGRDLRLMIISGPNMSGKSTFVRALGVNAVLAQCGGPVCAHHLHLSPFQVTASICVLDSLQGGISRFYAEITRLKLIADLAKQPVPVLFLLDELLSGTNSDDRCSGAEAFVKCLVERNAVGLITTHDLALTHIVKDMNSQAANFHFEDRLENGKLRFDFRLVSGVAQSSNALKLMRSIGLDV
jgi:MutS-like protein